MPHPNRHGPLVLLATKEREDTQSELLRRLRRFRDSFRFQSLLSVFLASEMKEVIGEEVESIPLSLLFQVFHKQKRLDNYGTLSLCMMSDDQNASRRAAIKNI